MTAEAHNDYDNLHRLVDRLKPAQADAVRAVVLQLVTDEDAEGERRETWPPAWFGSITAGQPDTAERSREILRAEYGQQ